MKASFVECWEWVLTYIKSGKKTRDRHFPNGDDCGVSNIIREIIRTLSGRITATRYRHATLFLQLGATTAKRVRPQIDTVTLPTPCPLLTQEKKKITAIAAALDMAAATRSTTDFDSTLFAEFGGVVWQRLLQVYHDDQAAGRLCDATINEADLRLIAGSANLHDAAAAMRSGDYQPAIGLMTGAALLVSGADLPFKLATAEKEVRKQEERQAKASEKRHEKSKALKERVLLLANEKHKQEPFKDGHAEVINWLINDNGTSRYFDEAKKLGVTPTHSNAAKTLRDWLADTDIPKKGTGTSKKSKANTSN